MEEDLRLERAAKVRLASELEEARMSLRKLDELTAAAARSDERHAAAARAEQAAAEATAERQATYRRLELQRVAAEEAAAGSAALVATLRGEVETLRKSVRRLQGEHGARVHEASARAADFGRSHGAESRAEAAARASLLGAGGGADARGTAAYAEALQRSAGLLRPTTDKEREEAWERFYRHGGDAFLQSAMKYGVR